MSLHIYYMPFIDKAGKEDMEENMKFYYENLKHPSIAIKGENLNYSAHLHRELELVFVLEGELEVTINGNEILLTNNQLCIIEPNSIHSFITRKSCIYYVIIFDCAILTELNDLFNYKSCDNCVIFADDELFSTILRLEQLQWDDDIKLIKGYLLILMAKVLKQTGLISKKYENTNLIESILSYINENYTEPVDLKSLAQQFNISREHLSRMFKNKLNINFKDYITMLRIETAKNHLINSGDSILQVAINAGFDNERTFHRVFKSKVGLTPKQFRLLT